MGLLVLSNRVNLISMQIVKETDSLAKLALMKRLGSVARNDQQQGKDGHCHETLVILWRVDLLPHNEWEPGLHNIGHLVHGGHDDGSFLVVISTDFVRPATSRELVINVREGTAMVTDAMQRPDKP